MDILKFFIANWNSVLLVVAVAVNLIVLYKHGCVGIVKKVLFALVAQAEKEFGSGTGELKNRRLYNGFMKSCRRWLLVSYPQRKLKI